MNDGAAIKLRGGAVKVVRVKNRVYDERRIISHAEYAVVDGEQVLAYIIFNRRSWIAVQRSAVNSFGKPISPINLKLLREVKSWAIEKLEKTELDHDHR